VKLVLLEASELGTAQWLLPVSLIASRNAFPPKRWLIQSIHRLMKRASLVALNL
jgi:hypothetical protein